MIFEPGRLCVKLAGRDAGKICVIVEAIDSQFVLIDGSTRRKKVNIKHLEPLNKVIEVKNRASHEEVVKAFKSLSLPVWENKNKLVAVKPKKRRSKSKQDKTNSAASPAKA